MPLLVLNQNKTLKRFYHKSYDVSHHAHKNNKKKLFIIKGSGCLLCISGSACLCGGHLTEFLEYCMPLLDITFLTEISVDALIPHILKGCQYRWNINRCCPPTILVVAYLSSISICVLMLHILNIY